MCMRRIIRFASAMYFGVLVGACNEPRPAGFATPSPVPAPTAPLHTLSGLVTERFSGRPVQGANISIWPQQIPAGGWSARVVRSDGNGRYEFHGLPVVGRVWATAADTGDAFRYAYVQQCATTVTIEGDTALDLVVSSTADLTALNLGPPSTPSGSRVVSGTIYEQTATGRQPASNVWVGWDAFLDTVVAETRSDSDGHYVLCGMPTDRTTGLFAAPAYGNVVYATVDAGLNAVLDFEITRK